MPDETQSSHPTPEPSVEQHLQGAHSLLRSLQEKVGEHPELAQAITNLEMALSILTVKTAGVI
ncbi:MAG: hypothetical protein H0X25_23790 [Acidobacteriales bacterium]|nr:hypothetical protein [Terriglobales bacterium]